MLTSNSRSSGTCRSYTCPTNPRAVALAGPDRIACVTIIPGYDDSKLGRPAPRPVTAAGMWTGAVT